MTPHKSEACRAEIEMLLENDMIEPSKSPWACGKVMAKKKEGDGNLYFLVTGATRRSGTWIRKPSLVLDEIERLPHGKGSEGTLPSSVRSDPRTTPSTGVVCTDTRNLL